MDIWLKCCAILRAGSLIYVCVTAIESGCSKIRWCLERYWTSYVCSSFWASSGVGFWNGFDVVSWLIWSDVVGLRELFRNFFKKRSNSACHSLLQSIPNLIRFVTTLQLLAALYVYDGFPRAWCSLAPAELCHVVELFRSLGWTRLSVRVQQCDIRFKPEDRW